jgi:peptidyl-prolyl cis-trans isomerase D
MMQDLREKTKIIMIVVAVAFVALMVFEWGMDISGQSAAVQTGELGRVNGQPIPYQAYATAYQELYQRAQQQTGGEPLSREQVRELEDAAFDRVVNDILLSQEMERRGIEATAAEIRQAAQWSPHPDLMQNEMFQTDGQFDITKYQQFLSSPAANEELLLQLEEYYRQVIPRNKLLRRVSAGAYVSDAQLWQMWRDRNETATVGYVALSVSQLVPGEVEVSDAEVRAHFDANRDRLQRPATARLSLVSLSKLPTAADTAAALQRAERLRAEIVGGGDFAEIARRESADPGSRDAGGDLGFFTRGRMAGPFEEAAFSLPIGAVSQPVQTRFGYHLMQVQERQADSVRARHILIPAEPSEEAVDRLYARADSLEDLATRAGLQRAGRVLQAEVREGVVATEDQPLVPGIGSVLEAVEWARDVTSNDTGETVSPLFETPQSFYVARLEGFTPAGRMSLEDAAPQIRRQLITEKKRALARQIGGEIVREVRSGEKALEQAARERGLSVESAGPFTRMAFNPVFGQASPAVGAAFGTAIGEVSDVVDGGVGLYIVRPTAHTQADREAFEAQKDQMRAVATYQAQQEIVNRWVNEVRERARIDDRRAETLSRS